jgi:replicative DNA helicase
MKKQGKVWSNEAIKEGTAKREDLAAGAEAYKRFAKWITIIEGDSRNNIGDIRLKAQREKMKTGKAPVIIIDYLQILPIADASMRDKRSEVDFLVSELRRIARDIEAPIIAISSMSRAEYKSAKMTGFKESGGIEYGTDIAAVLTVEEEKKGGQDAGTIRTVALNIIKNRNGRRGKIGMSYNMLVDTFSETDLQHLSYLEALGVDEDDKPF